VTSFPYYPPVPVPDQTLSIAPSSERRPFRKSQTEQAGENTKVMHGKQGEADDAAWMPLMLRY